MSIESPPLERKLVAILAADVEGYSRMMHDDEEATLRMLSAHRIIVDRLIAQAGGNITSTAGDSVLAEFASVIDAVKCAVAVQTDIKVANAAQAAHRHMLFRIGINVGDVMVKDGGIFGDGVNVAARVEALAPPGGICVTRGVRDHVRDRLPYMFEDRGDQAVKNITRPVHVFRVIFDRDELETFQRETISLASPAAPVQDEGTDVGDGELAFWKSVESGNRAEEYQAYLDRFPEGMFAALAATRIASAPSAAAPAPLDPSVELMFWDSVKDSDEPSMFRAYLDQYPNGLFKVIAELRIQRSEGSSAVHG